MADSEEVPRYQLRLFGFPSLRVAGSELPVTRRKFLASLAYLSLSFGHSASRRRIATLLWPESTPDQALTALRQTYKEVRSRSPVTFGEILSSNRIGIELRAENLRTDYVDMLEMLDHGRVPPELLSVRQIPDTFLAGFDDIGREFRVWVSSQRVAIHSAFMTRLTTLADGTATPISTRRQIGTAIRNLDPANELGCRLLMQASADEGNVAEAVRAYGEMEENLFACYGLKPSDEIRTLMEHLKGGGRVPAAPLPAASPSLTIHLSEFGAAFLPPEQTSFLEAFRQDLTVSLLKFRQWDLVQTRDGEAPREGAVLGCMAMADENDIILMLTVRDVRSGRVVWGETYRVSVQGWYRNQRRIIRSVASALNSTLSSNHLARLKDVADMDLSIHDRWLRGISLSLDWHPHADLRAERIFKSIISERPDHAGAKAMLATFTTARPHVFPGTTLGNGRREEVLSLARDAVSSDPTSSLSHASLGWALAWNGHFPQAASSFRSSVEMNPYDVNTLIWSALGLSLTGDIDRAGRIADGVIEDGAAMTRSNQSHLGVIRLFQGDIEGGMQLIRLSGDTVPSALGFQTAILAAEGRDQEAWASADQFRKAVRRRWFGGREPTDQVIGAWMINAMTISDERLASRLALGLSRTGFLPDGGHQPTAPEELRPRKRA